MRWERDGYALDTADTDWKDCRSESIGYANRWIRDPFPYTYMARDTYGRAYTSYHAWPYPSRFMIEQDYLDSCLRSRGYQRVPVQPTDEQTVEPAFYE
jgi:hypothetical protein